MEEVSGGEKCGLLPEPLRCMLFLRTGNLGAFPKSELDGGEDYFNFLLAALAGEIPCKLSGCITLGDQFSAVPCAALLVLPSGCASQFLVVFASPGSLAF